MVQETEASSGKGFERTKKAHLEANRLIVGAGLVLAGAGIPRQAPQMKALSAALRAVNLAGGIEGFPAVRPAEREVFRAHSPTQVRRPRRAAL